MSKKINILLVDDDPDFLNLMALKITNIGYNPISAQTSEECLSFLSGNDKISAILMDIEMPEISGIDLLREIKKEYKTIPIIMNSASKNLDVAVTAMKFGAIDFLSKSSDMKRIKTVIHNAVSINQLQNRIGVLQNQIKQNNIFKGIIGKSKAIKDVFKQLELTLDNDVNILLLGESGTGKELLASAIHKGSRRSKGPFVVVNSSAISTDLAESLLFGYKKGSFTGATEDRAGYFEMADNGTIFLDEIGDMTSELQAKVLRVIQEKKVRRIGEKKERTIDFRLISATNNDLTEKINNNEFRSDLYYRLEEYPVIIPPLRKRGRDIVLLAEYFLKSYASINDTNQIYLAESATMDLLNHKWPGNIRELKNVILRTAMQCKCREITDIYFSKDKKHNKVAKQMNIATEVKNGTTNLISADSEIKPLHLLEREAIEHAYKTLNGNIDKAAVMLEISRATMYRKLKEYGVLN